MKPTPYIPSSPGEHKKEKKKAEGNHPPSFSISTPPDTG